MYTDIIRTFLYMQGLYFQLLPPCSEFLGLLAVAYGFKEAAYC